MSARRRLVVALGVATLVGCRAAGTESGDSGAKVIPPGAVEVAAPTPTPPAPALGAAPVAPLQLAGSTPLSFAPLVHVADPSVVFISTLTSEMEPSPFSRRARQRVAQGLGTGFVFDKNGVILTNNHVIEGADEIEVKLSDGRRFPGKVVGTDKTTDIGVLHIDAKDLRPLPLGDSDAIEVGDWAVAIGNPFGLSHTVSAGIVSAKDRTRDDVPLDPAGTTTSCRRTPRSTQATRGVRC